RRFSVNGSTLAKCWTLFLCSALCGWTQTLPSRLTPTVGTTLSNVALTASPNPSVLGRSVVLTATMTPPATTGYVAFYAVPRYPGLATLPPGKAVLTTALLDSGARSLRAYYGGDAIYAASTSANLAITVNALAGNGFDAPVGYPAGGSPAFV